MELDKIITNNPSLESSFDKLGVKDNIRERTRHIALWLGVTSLCLDDKEYNPQTRLFGRIPNDKLIDAHNQLYTRYNEAL